MGLTVFKVKVKVKCTLVQALRLCIDRTAHRGSRGIALPFHDHGTTRGWGVSVKPRPLFTPGKDPVPIVEEAGWAPGPVWKGAENPDSPGFDPRTVQTVTSRYTDWATGSTIIIKTLCKILQIHRLRIWYVTDFPINIQGLAIYCLIYNYNPWFKNFAVFYMSYSFSLVVLRSLNFICRRFATLCSILISDGSRKKCRDMKFRRRRIT